MQPDRVYLEVMNIVAGLTVGGEQIPFEPYNHYEIYILASGGVEVRDFEEAAEIWVKSNLKNYSSHWGYIRTTALAIAAKRKLIQSEVL